MAVYRKRLKISKLLIALASVSIMLSGCALNSVYEEEGVLAFLPDTWKFVPQASESKHTNDQASQWWQGLHNPQLNDLMRQALLQNNDLKESALRLQQAALRTETSALAGMPKPSLGLSNSTQVPLSDGRNLSSSYGASFGLSQELDFWGRLDERSKISHKQLNIAQSDLEVAHWLITSGVAKQYWAVAVIDQKIILAKQAKTDAEVRHKVTQLRLDMGLIQHNELNQSTANLTVLNERLFELSLQRVNGVMGLALYLDLPPQTFILATATLPAHYPSDPLSLPVLEVLDRLPKLRRGRLALDVAASNHTIVQTNWYPIASASASIASGGTELVSLLSGAAGSLGLSLALPFVDWKRLSIDRVVSDIDLQLAAIEFRKLLHETLVEIDQQYGNRQQWLANQELLQLQLEHANNELHTTKLRYQEGIVAQVQVLDAKRAVRDLQRSELDLKLSAWSNYIDILRAWGGPTSGFP